MNWYKKAQMQVMSPQMEDLGLDNTDLMDDKFIEEFAKKIREKVAKRNIDIFKDYYISDRRTTYAEIGHKYGLSRERIRRIIISIMIYIRHILFDFNKYGYITKDMTEKEIVKLLNKVFDRC